MATIATGSDEAVADASRGIVDLEQPVGETGWTPLMLAAEHDRLEVVLLLLAAGASPRTSGRGGWTALHVAVDAAIDSAWQAGRGVDEAAIEVISALLSAGADPLAKDNDGRTPLGEASAYHAHRVVRVLNSAVPVR